MDADAKRRIDELEDRIADLEATVRELRDGSHNDASSGREVCDRYDEYVLEAVDDVAEADPRTVMSAYRDAGIVNRSKRKTRAKRLKRLEGRE